MNLEVEARETRGKNAARRLRAEGKVPATLYGLDKEAEALALDTKTMTRMLSRVEDRNTVLHLQGGATGSAMATDWQVEPVYGKLLHVDLRRIDEDTKVRVKVALKTHGVAYGVKTEGGMEDVILREAEVLCLPNEAPDSIDIDVTEMRAGESVRIKDLPTEGKFEFVGNPEMVVVRIVGKRGLQMDQETAEVEAEAEAEAKAEAEAQEAAEEEEEKSEE